MRYTKSTLKKLEDIFISQGYTIRYERGNFHSGHCLVQERKVIIINKFFKGSARFDCLHDIARKLELNAEDDFSTSVFDLPLPEDSMALRQSLVSQT